jgi:hypothetical protein
MSVFDYDPPALTRADFNSSEGWYRHCHRSGERPFDDGDDFNGITACGYDSGLAAGIWGHTRPQFLRAVCGYATSARIGRSKYHKLFNAIALANCLGFILNTRIDITWSLAGVRDDLEVADCQSRLLDWLRRWLARHNCAAYWIWVLERGKRRGLHTHMMVHIPSDLYLERFTRYGSEPPFREQLEAALERILGRPLVRRKGEKTLHLRHRSNLDTTHQWLAFQYRAKGVGGDPDIASEKYGLHRVSDEGEVVTKRVGVSRVLDDKNVRRLTSVNDFPSFALPPGPKPFDNRYINWNREFGHTIWTGAVSINGNICRRDAGFEVEPMDIEDAVRNGRVSRQPPWDEGFIIEPVDISKLAENGRMPPRQRPETDGIAR